MHSYAYELLRGMNTCRVVASPLASRRTPATSSSGRRTWLSRESRVRFVGPTLAHPGSPDSLVISVIIPISYRYLSLLKEATRRRRLFLSPVGLRLGVSAGL